MKLDSALFASCSTKPEDLKWPVKWAKVKQICQVQELQDPLNFRNDSAESSNLFEYTRNPICISYVPTTWPNDELATHFKLWSVITLQLLEFRSLALLFPKANFSLDGKNDFRYQRRRSSDLGRLRRGPWKKAATPVQSFFCSSGFLCWCSNIVRRQRRQGRRRPAFWLLASKAGSSSPRMMASGSSSSHIFTHTSTRPLNFSHQQLSSFDEEETR